MTGRGGFALAVYASRHEIPECHLGRARLVSDLPLSRLKTPRPNPVLFRGRILSDTENGRFFRVRGENEESTLWDCGILRISTSKPVYTGQTAIQGFGVSLGG